MAFIEFKDIKSKNNVRATITSHGDLSFTAGGMRKFMIDLRRDRYAKLYFDPAEKKIGLKLIMMDDGYAVKIRPQGQGFKIVNKAFFETYHIMPKETCNYDVTMEDDMLVVDLKTARPRVAALDTDDE